MICLHQTVREKTPQLNLFSSERHCIPSLKDLQEMMLHTQQQGYYHSYFRNIETEIQIQNHLVIVTVKAYLLGNRIWDNITVSCFSISLIIFLNVGLPPGSQIMRKPYV